MKIKLIGCVIVMHLALLLWSQNKIEWVPPLDIPFSLSGTFGEPRSTHFHLGIDIKTQGKEGWDIGERCDYALHPQAWASAVIIIQLRMATQVLL